MLLRMMILFLAILTTTPAAAQTGAVDLAERIQALVVDGGIRGDDATIREAAILAERALAAHPGDPWLLHYQGMALYRLAARRACDKAAEPDCVWKLLERAEAALKASAAARPVPETWALLGSVYGLMTGERPMLGAALGGRIDDLQARALALDPDNPRVWLLKGIGDLHTPPAYGGGPEAALASFERAATAFDADDPAPPAPRWGRVDVHVWTGQAHAARGDRAAARAAYEHVLEIEAGHTWVRDILLPALEDNG